MKAIILAAGYATRLYPLTKNYPKALLPVAGKPILEYTLEKIAPCREIDRIYIVTNQKFFPIFQEWLAGYRPDASLSPSTGLEYPGCIEILNDDTRSNEERLGSVGDLKLVVERKALDDDLLVICSDKLFEFSLGDFVDFFKERREAANACFDTGDVERIRNKHGCVVLDREGRIGEFQEKPRQPKSSIQSVAFYIYPRQLIPLIERYLEEGHNPDAPGYLAQWIARQRPMYAFLFTEPCYDVGTPAAYRQVDRLYRAGKSGATDSIQQAGVH